MQFFDLKFKILHIFRILKFQKYQLALQLKHLIFFHYQFKNYKWVNYQFFTRFSITKHQNLIWRKPC